MTAPPLNLKTTTPFATLVILSIQALVREPSLGLPSHQRSCNRKPKTKLLKIGHEIDY